MTSIASSSLSLLLLAAVGLGVGVAVCARTSRTAILLGVAASSPTFALRIGGSRVHLFVIVAILWIAARPSRVLHLHVQRSQAWVVLACVPLAATVLIGPLVNQASLGLVLLGLGMALLVTAHVSWRHDRLLVRAFLGTSFMGFAVALLQLVHLAPGRLVHQDISSIGRPTGWFGEPDWLGLFAAVTLLLLVSDRWFSKRVQLAGTVLTVSALVVSFTRAAWIASAVGLLLHAAISRRAVAVGGSRGRGRRLLAAVLIGTVGLVAVPQLRTDLASRAQTVLGGGRVDVGGRARTQQREALLELADTAPWYGDGLSASGRVGVSGRLILDRRSDNNVGSNWLLALWVDGKLLAVPLLMAITAVAVVNRRSRFLPVLAAIFVSSLVSNAFYFPLTWFALAMLATSHSSAAVVADGPESRHALRDLGT